MSDDNIVLSIAQSEKIKRRVALGTYFNIAFIGVAITAYIFGKNSIDSKSNVYAFPLEMAYEVPDVYGLGHLNLKEENAKVLKFVRDYVHLTVDQSLVNYTRVHSNKRYTNELNDNLKRAFNLSAGQARQKVSTMLGESYQIFKSLKAQNSGYEFLVDCINIDRAVPGMLYVADVYGEKQSTRDHARTDRAHKTFEYQKIRYKIMAGPKLHTERNGKEVPLNGYGLYVVDIEDVALGPKEIKRSITGCGHEDL